jgi:hypothetical protein
MPAMLSPAISAGRRHGSFQQGPKTQWELMCPNCYSRPRHRTAYRFFHERTDLFDSRPKRMLHVAPEAALAPKFRAIPWRDYLSSVMSS